MKYLKKSFIFIIFILLFTFTFSSNVIDVLAEENKPIYYEDKVLETNNLPGGVMHKKVMGFSQVTNHDESMISPHAKEAGSANQKPIEFNKYYSQQVNVLEVPNNKDIKVVPWGLINNGGWSLSKVQDMATDYEKNNPGWKIVAAVNGDFFDISGGGSLPFGPIGTMKTDGEMYRMYTNWPMLGINNIGNGKRLVGKMAGEVSTTPTPMLAIYDENDQIIKQFAVDTINATPASGKLGVYFAIYNNEHVPVPVDVDDAYIVDKPIDTLAFTESSIYGKGVISRKHQKATIEKNQFAIVTDNKEITNLLDVNVKVRVQYEITDEDYKDMDCVIGFHDKVIVNGTPSYDHFGYASDRYPRNLFGVKEDGTIVVVVVDGRQPENGYYGIAAEETGAIVKYYGMYDGFQMDGGGSATMIVLKDGELQVVNSPSDSGGGASRTDSNGILVAMKVDKIDYEISKTSDSLEFSVKVVENVEKYKDLFIEVNGEKKRVQDGKVKFTGLKNRTEYVYRFYNKVGDEYLLLPYQGSAYTNKITPVLKDITINIVDNNGIENYVIEYNLIDPDATVFYAVLNIDNKKYWQKEGKFIYSVEGINILNAKNWFIEIEYSVNDNNEKQTIKISDCDIKFGSVEVVFDAQLESITDQMKSLFR